MSRCDTLLLVIRNKKNKIYIPNIYAATYRKLSPHKSDNSTSRKNRRVIRGVNMCIKKGPKYLFKTREWRATTLPMRIDILNIYRKFYDRVTILFE